MSNDALDEALFRLSSDEAAINADPQLGVKLALDHARHARLAEFVSGVSEAAVDRGRGSPLDRRPERCDPAKRIESTLMVIRRAQSPQSFPAVREILRRLKSSYEQGTAEPTSIRSSDFLPPTAERAGLGLRESAAESAIRNARSGGALDPGDAARPIGRRRMNWQKAQTANHRTHRENTEIRSWHPIYG